MNNTWQAVESAPKDGTMILGFAIVDTATGNWKMRIMWCSTPQQNGLRNNWEGWGDNWIAPTHWMPLPKPPVGMGA